MSNGPGEDVGLHIVELRAHRASHGETPGGGAITDRPITDRAAGETETDSPTVILVHGSLDRATSFMRTARRLEDLAVVLYDRRGYSRSRAVKPIATDLDTHVDDLFE